MTDTTQPSRESPEFAGQVNSMFDRVADRYDLLNSVMTRGAAPSLARARGRRGLNWRPGDSALDVCCGTGDLTLELAGAGRSPGGHVVGCDFSEPMLDLAREKAAERGADGRPFRVGRCAAAALRRRALRRGHGRLRGPQPGRPGSRAWREMARVLRPAAALVVLEITQPTRPPLSTFYSLWFDRIVPLLGRFSDDPEAYAYLPESVRSFPAPRGLAEKMDARRARADPLHGSRRAGSSRSTAASAGDPALGDTAAGHGGARRLQPLAAGPAGRGRGAAPRAGARLRRAARRGRGATPGRRRQATAAAARLALRRRRGRRAGGGAGGGRDRAGPHGDPGPRRRPRRRAAASRPADGRRHLGPARARRRPATCSSRAPSLCWRRPTTPARSSCSPLPRSRWRDGELAQRQRRLRCRHLRAALPRALPAEDRDPVRMRLPARPRRRSLCRASGPRSGSPSSSSTTCSTSPGRPSAPARRAAPTCSTAPSPCR